ncbi:hypothetical protein N431DRAFT_542827 [Stipitochalara longipes BDJ]|nr:hypothetical protein N431DRAFT_542827 [Stipitochalara longipes BDJ]
MPRHASEHYLQKLKSSSVTCRQRKIKCDEAQPVCSNCQRAQRECQRPERTLKYVIHSADPEQQKSLVESQVSQTSQLQNQDNDGSDILGAKFFVSALPKVALENQVIAALFRHYIDFLASWYDLNDSQNLFGTLVPQRAMNNPILFKAVIAFSACHVSRTSGEGRYQDLGHEYHAACIRDLLEVLSDVHPEMQGDFLATTCLLRSYEILNGDTRQQHHLLGAYSLASSAHIDLSQRGLPQSGTWNYLREEITVALELRRPVRMGSGFEFVPSANMADDMWSNYISYILAKIINFCFDVSSSVAFEQRKSTWQELETEVSGWRENRSRSFNAFSTAPKSGNAFPSIWLLSPWHVAGEQYFAVAEILLALSQPGPNTPQFGIVGRENSQAAVESHVLKICGLAFTNNNVSARVNAFGPLAFCGRYLIQHHHREDLVNMLQYFSIPTGWPVQPIIEDLRQHWVS